jgi:threonylcarbamoyladenosine tRNA methylthiotransferase MtaB
LPLQSGDDSVLKAMGRGYTSGDFADLVQRIRSGWPDAAVTTDVMVGFPGETDEQFRRSMDFVRETAFSRVHVFSYSSRPDTRAAERSDSIPAEVKRKRAQEMRSLGHELARCAARTWVGKEVSVLFEEMDGRGRLTGHTPHYQTVRASGPQSWVGRIVEVTPDREEDGLLCAGISADKASD